MVQTIQTIQSSSSYKERFETHFNIKFYPSLSQPPPNALWETRGQFEEISNSLIYLSGIEASRKTHSVLLWLRDPENFRSIGCIWECVVIYLQQSTISKPKQTCEQRMFPTVQWLVGAGCHQLTGPGAGLRSPLFQTDENTESVEQASKSVNRPGIIHWPPVTAQAWQSSPGNFITLWSRIKISLKEP